MLRGRAFSAALLTISALLLAVGAGMVLAALGGALLGVGTGLALLGAEGVLAALFLVPTGQRSDVGGGL